MRSKPLMLLCLLAPALAGAQPWDDPEALREALALKIRTVQHMALNPVLVRAVRRQNAEGLSAQEIAERDRAWADARNPSPLVWALQQSRAGRFLQARVAAGPDLSEAFVTDARGANVAAYPRTTDYFQGDEPKWSAAFNEGRGRVHVGPVERDASTGIEAVQISAPVIDRGRTIGVLVVGVTVEYLDKSRAVAAR